MATNPAAESTSNTGASASGGAPAPELSKEEEYYRDLYSKCSEEVESAVYDKPDKRTKNVVDWEQFHMLVAVLSSRRSKDPNQKVGACIVDADHKIVGIGHNKLPDGVDEEKFKFWKNRDIEKDGFMETKYPYVCHAAIHAILNKNAENLHGCTLYVTLFPSHEDAKMIIQAGIRKVVYLDDDYHDHTFTKIARKLFETANPRVECIGFTFSLAQGEFEPAIFPIPSSCLNPQALRPDQKHAKCPDPTPASSSEPTTADKDFFMALACLTARRSKDPNRQVGTCIVNGDGQVVGVGYNGFVKGIDDDDKRIPWAAEKDQHPAKQKLPYVVHAEPNAIMHKTCIDLKDCSLYTTFFPCNECAKIVIQAGIKKIYYLMNDKPKKVYMESSRKLFLLAGYQVDGTRGSGERRFRDASQKICQQYIPTREYNMKDEINSHTTSSYNSIRDRLFNLVACIGPVVVLVGLVYSCIPR